MNNIECLKGELMDIYKWFLGSVPLNRNTGKWISDSELLYRGEDYYDVTIFFHLVDGMVLHLSNNALKCWQENTIRFCEQLHVREDYVRLNYNEVIPYTAICWIDDKIENVDWAAEIAKRKKGGA